MSESDQKRTCLITGASSGIGYELAEVCAAQGHDLVLVARRQAELEARAGELANRYSVLAHAIALDLAVPNAAAGLIQILHARQIDIDMLVNNAGVALQGPFATSDIERQLGLLRLNVEALTHLTRLLLPPMLKRGFGRILNVASIASYMPGPMVATYFASKAYVLSFSQALSDELSGTGVTATALIAGPTRSGFADAAGLAKTKAFVGPVMSARAVAECAYAAMMGGKRVAVAGLRNRLRLLPLRFVPARMLAYFARKYHELPPSVSS